MSKKFHIASLLKFKGIRNTNIKFAIVLDNVVVCGKAKNRLIGKFVLFEMEVSSFVCVRICVASPRVGLLWLSLSTRKNVFLFRRNEKNMYQSVGKLGSTYLTLPEGVYKCVHFFYVHIFFSD